MKEHKCPICQKITTDEKYRPFCSKHCADVDLGRWFNGSYSVPVENLDPADEEELKKEFETLASKKTSTIRTSD